MSPLRLIQFTDTHLYGEADGKLRGVATYPALLAAIEHARARHWPCQAILATGDLVQDDAGGYEHFRRIFARFGKPVLCIPGNHDFVPQMRVALAGRPFELDGPADIGAWRVVLPFIDAFSTRISRPRFPQKSVMCAARRVTQPLWMDTPCPTQIESPKKISLSCRAFIVVFPA